MLDEFQDVSADEWDFLQAILEKAGEDTRIIAAGDDDQSIYEFRGASIQHMRSLIDNGAKTHFLTKNYRAAANLVAFSNAFLQRLPSERIKADHTLVPVKKENGTLRILRYHDGSLFEPIADAIANQPSNGTRALLTATNEQAAIVHATLKQKGIPAILLTDKDGFQIRDLQEFVEFTQYLKDGLQASDEEIISQSNWSNSIRKLKERFPRPNKTTNGVRSTWRSPEQRTSWKSIPIDLSSTILWWTSCRRFKESVSSVHHPNKKSNAG
ncbi:MAG: ATP-dependent helicase [Bacteroidetes bacterium]|nr:ATP-dependent helicase [Bacteroidota bacterium]